MNSTSYFDRLVASAERIARHAAYPGKEQALDQCINDLDDLADTGRITVEQRERLRAVLLGGPPHARAPVSWLERNRVLPFPGERLADSCAKALGCLAHVRVGMPW